MKARTILLALILSASSRGSVDAQGASLLGRWQPYPPGQRNNTWLELEFRNDSSVVVTIPVPASATYRVEGKQLMTRFQDGSGNTADFRIVGDTLIETAPNQAHEVRLIRTTRPTAGDSSIVGTWKGEWGPFNKLFTFTSDGQMQIRATSMGTTSISGDTLTITLARLPATLKFQVTLRPDELTLSPLDGRSPTHFRRAPP